MSDMMKAFNEALEGLDAEFADAVVGQIADDQRAVDLIFDRLLELYIARASSRHLLALVSLKFRPPSGWTCDIMENGKAPAASAKQDSPSEAINEAIRIAEGRSEKDYRVDDE
jgi:hypothetical protein